MSWVKQPFYINSLFIKIISKLTINKNIAFHFFYLYPNRSQLDKEELFYGSDLFERMVCVNTCDSHLHYKTLENCVAIVIKSFTSSLRLATVLSSLRYNETKFEYSDPLFNFLFFSFFFCWGKLLYIFFCFGKFKFFFLSVCKDPERKIEKII